MTTLLPAPLFRAPRAAADGFRLLRVDFPGRCHPEHGDLPLWDTPTADPTDRGNDR